MLGHKKNDITIDKIAGSVIRSLRKENNLSGYELGNLTGISQQQISRYESGCSCLTLNMLINILFALNSTLDEFLYRLSVQCGFSERKFLNVLKKEYNDTLVIFDKNTLYHK
ncbi:helix-turn-helix transcriptional regulator [Morganella morganii]|uniref:helix-turn-helix domain-containing protein n=1 Tax=Morganella morganii TaxID=582 RepID=UPI0032DBA75F